ncbi:MAG: cupin domain-containing protein [Acidobacteria bacterium]|nr:cupin domain-containing protein [Acidobacteriota bacterium]
MMKRLVVRRSSFLVLAAAILGAALGVALDRVALAQQSGIKRTILTRADVPASATHEAVMGLAEIAPGASSGRHYHHGMEIGYVLEGSVVIEHQGKPIATVKAGEAFKNEVTAVHDAKNPGTTPARILAVYVVEKGKPLAEPAQ